MADKENKTGVCCAVKGWGVSIVVGLFVVCTEQADCVNTAEDTDSCPRRSAKTAPKDLHVLLHVSHRLLDSFHWLTS